MDRKPQADRAPGGGLFAAGGVASAVLASSCCILPLALVMLGVSGAWIGGLTALEPYRPYMLVGAALLLGSGFWRVYVGPRRACADGAACAARPPGAVVKAALWTGAVLAALAATVDGWAPLLY